jgi:hypothetical protein
VAVGLGHEAPSRTHPPFAALIAATLSGCDFSNLKIIERVYDIQRKPRADSTECFRSYDFVPVKVSP